jgi:hypothetical protein
MKLARSGNKRINTALLVVIVALVTIGGVLLIRASRADSNFIATEPETGQVNAPAASGVDTTASGGKYVKFPASPGIAPYGYADYCTLEGTNTVIYGWAYDPDASANNDPSVTLSLNTVSKTVPTDQAGYRDAAINTWIDTYRKGDAKPGSYGFKAVFSGLSKSTIYNVSGTAINVGGGANAVLHINDGGYVDGDPTKISFIANQIPQECLPGTPAVATTPCGNTMALPYKYDHVLWIYEENHTFSQVINNANAPYMTSLAKACGSSSQHYDNLPLSELYPGVTTIYAHSSISYNADTAGSDCTYGNGVHGTDCWMSTTSTFRYNLPWRTIFQQVTENGGTWRNYEESAPGNCYPKDSGLYVWDHNPVVNFTNNNADCAANDLAIPAIVCPDKAGSCTTAPTGRLISDIKAGTLPNYGVIIPNLNNEMHNGTVNQADTWLKTYLTPLFASAEYKKGRTAVFVMWDEPFSRTATEPILAISATAKGGIVTTQMNNYTVLGNTEAMLGITERLGCASGTPPHAPGQAPPAGSSCFQGAATNLRTLFHM